MAKYIQGRFSPKNPRKYRGDCTNIIFRSSWEMILMQRLDQNPEIIWWQSEETVIPYIDKGTGTAHRYFPDFLWCKKNKDGSSTTILCEIKPLEQTLPPPLREGQSVNNRSYVKKVMLYAKNRSKWEAAERFAKQRNWQFVIITEKDLGLG